MFNDKQPAKYGNKLQPEPQVLPQKTSRNRNFLGITTKFYKLTAENNATMSSNGIAKFILMPLFVQEVYRTPVSTRRILVF
jgi:hypothetical protein